MDGAVAGAFIVGSLLAPLIVRRDPAGLRDGGRPARSRPSASRCSPRSTAESALATARDRVRRLRARSRPGLHAGDRPDRRGRPAGAGRRGRRRSRRRAPSSAARSASRSSAASAPPSTAARWTDAVPAGVPPEAAEAARDTLGGAVAAGDELPGPLAARAAGRGPRGLHPGAAGGGHPQRRGRDRRRHPRRGAAATRADAFGARAGNGASSPSERWRAAAGRVELRGFVEQTGHYMAGNVSNPLHAAPASGFARLALAAPQRCFTGAVPRCLASVCDERRRRPHPAAGASRRAGRAAPSRDHGGRLAPPRRSSSAGCAKSSGSCSR